MTSHLKKIAICFAAGAIYALCYPSELIVGWLPLLFISMPLFLWQLEDSKTFWHSVIILLSFNTGLNLVGYYWIPQTLREFGQLPWIVSIILGLLFSLILQPHWWLYALFKRYRPSWQWNTERAILVTAFIMTVMERYFPQQFPSFAGSPWLHLAPYLGLAPHLGVVAFSFMTYWLCLEIVTQIKLQKFRPQVWIVFVIFIILNAIIPLQEISTGKKMSVRIVQANIGNFLKVSSERGDSNSFESIIQNYYDLSTRDNGFRPDLIIWPETAYPETFSGHKSQIDPLFQKITRVMNSEMLIGGYDQDPSKTEFDFIETVFNSSILISEDKLKTSYHKNILIPFGETLPFGPFNRQIVSIVPAVSLFARGDGTPLMETKKGYRFVTPICYEILESNYMRTLLNQWGENHFIVNHTNDSWYGDTAEPEQHLFLSKWRALEFQLPIVRSTNTGISSVIFPDGSESKRLGVGVQDILDVILPLGSGQSTIYQRFGVYPLLIIFFVFFGITWWRERN